MSGKRPSSRPFESKLHRRYAVFALGVLLFVGLLAMLERGGMPRAWLGATFLVATVAVYATIGLACRTADEEEYYVAGRRVPALYNGMATAADWMSAATFIGMAGAIFLKGFGGLAYILGWTGGFVLVGVLLAPYLRRFGRYTVPDFIGERYGGTAPRLMAVVATVLVSFVYVVVQIYGVGLITSHLTGFSFEVGIFVGLGGVLVCSFLGGMRAVTWTQVAQYIVLLVAYVVPVVWMSVSQTGNWLPQWAYQQQLLKVGVMERELDHDPKEREVIALLQQRAKDAERKLQDVPAAVAADARELARRVEAMRAADAPLAQIQRAEQRLAQLPRTEAAARAGYEREREVSALQARPLAGMPPMAQPYAAPEGSSVAAERLNFLALVLCLMMGTAAMPHVLTRYYTTPSVAQARRSVFWSLFFIVLLYVSAPALAVMAKYEVFASLVGAPFDELPNWIRRWAKVDPSLVSVEDVNGDGLLQLAELRLGADVIVLAAPEMGGLPYVITCLVAAGGLAAALSTADGLLLTVANAFSHDVYYRMVDPQASPIRRVMLSKMLVLTAALVAAWVASLRMTDILSFVTAAFSLAASALFPALVMGVFWRGASRLGATLSMLAGLGVCGWYMVTNIGWLRALFGITRPSAESRWFEVDPIAAGVFGVPVGFAVLVLGSWVSRLARPAEISALPARLQEPPVTP